MTAPAAPVITVRSDGTVVRVQFAAVPTAATYNLYDNAVLLVSGATASPIIVAPLTPRAVLTLKAVNIGAEASAASNTVTVPLTGPGVSFPATRPSDKGVRRGPFG